MKSIRKSSAGVANTRLASSPDEERRSFLQRIVASATVFATSIFVAKDAHAFNHDTCNCDSNCFPTNPWCWIGRGICWDPERKDYIRQAYIYTGEPHGGCCAWATAELCRVCNPPSSC